MRVGRRAQRLTKRSVQRPPHSYCITPWRVQFVLSICLPPTIYIQRYIYVVELRGHDDLVHSCRGRGVLFGLVCSAATAPRRQGCASGRRRCKERHPRHWRPHRILPVSQYHGAALREGLWPSLYHTGTFPLKMTYNAPRCVSARTYPPSLVPIVLGFVSPF